jgi:high-affinity iron transporter
MNALSLALESGLILLREGLEAMLVIAALAAFLNRAGAPGKVGTLYAGAGGAVVASIGAAIVFEAFFDGNHNDYVEADVLAIAAVLMIYMSGWMYLRQDPRTWINKLRGHAERALDSGTAVSLGAIAFLAVFREGAETVLFLHALAASSGGWGVALIGGLASAAIGLVAVYYAMQRLAMMLPLQPVFLVTSAFLFIMGLRFVGAGALTPCRDAGMQVGQQLAIGQPGDFRHEALDERQHPVGAVDEAVENLIWIDAAPLGSILVEKGLRPCHLLGRRQKLECEEIGALEMGAFLLELGPPLTFDQVGYRIGKRAGWIAPGWKPGRLDKDRPARAQTAQRVVEAVRDADQLGVRGTLKIGAPEASHSQEGAVLVEDDAFHGQRRPRQEVGEVLRLVAVFPEIEHDTTSNTQMGRIADVPTRYLNEIRIPLRGPDSGHLADHPHHQPGDPQLEAETQSG